LTVTFEAGRNEFAEGFDNVASFFRIAISLSRQTAARTEEVGDASSGTEVAMRRCV
jgi:hypothetical protein